MEQIDTNRRQLLKIGGAGVIGTGLAGCLGGGSGDGGSDTTNVGMVYATGGLGDNSFNDMAHKGIQNAEEEFDIQFKNTEPESQDDVSTLQRKLAQSGDPDYDLVCCIGFVQTTALKENAEKFSDQQFMVVDTVVEQDNVASYTFKEHQGSFQVGHLAGLLTDEDFSAGAGETTDDLTVGFVGGKEVPLIKKFEAGYKAGVERANEDVEILTAYAGAWSDPGKGQSIANSMYDKDADIIYHAAGGTGNGVFKAAQKKGRYALGVDADQSKSLSKYSDVILASMVKHVDEAVYRAVERTTDGELSGGSVQSLGLEQDGVAAVYGQDLGSEIPEEIKSKLEDSRQKIVDGDISVPDSTDE
ncbi:BMP family ABC transporter substrate-binding protein [Halobacteriales archaeon QS_1_67_19]|nr:MAG: BMP family ABC transporter substrate-binding protein [Halobacteriales archaeon QS_1_67_19]